MSTAGLFIILCLSPLSTEDIRLLDHFRSLRSLQLYTSANCPQTQMCAMNSESSSFDVMDLPLLKHHRRV